ncbi:hypothetical protein IFM12275_40520 [Nocardia sputorum]|nr:hypothetical protein IFM12275_40520 [Nocardia sputorum]
MVRCRHETAEASPELVGRGLAGSAAELPPNSRPRATGYHDKEKHMEATVVRRPLCDTPNGQTQWNGSRVDRVT